MGIISKNKSVTIDSRMFYSSGIGVYIRNNLIEVLKTDKFAIRLVVEKLLDGASLAIAEQTIVKAKIYTLDEQISLPVKVKFTNLYWSPHYIIPLLPLKTEKLLVTIHDINHLQSWFRKASIKEYFKSVFAEVLISFALYKADHIITVSDFTKNELLSRFKFDPTKITVVPLGIDHNFFKIYSKETITHKLKYLNIDPNYIVYLGNVKPHKNIVNLMLAFSTSVLLKKLDINLLIIGKKDNYLQKQNKIGETYNSLPNDIKKRIIFTGFVEDKDLPIILSGAKMMVFPSIYEGFGLPPLEAMACGCPTAVARAASIPEVCGDASIYFDPYDIDSIRNSVEVFFKDEELRTKYITKGLQHVKKFCWQKSGSAHLKIIEKLLSI